ncbi:hypothetical protein D3C71_1386840 [compost metagenome]
MVALNCRRVIDRRDVRHCLGTHDASHLLAGHLIGRLVAHAVHDLANGFELLDASFELRLQRFTFGFLLLRLELLRGLRFRNEPGLVVRAGEILRICLARDSSLLRCILHPLSRLLELHVPHLTLGLLAFDLGVRHQRRHTPTSLQDD